MSDDLEPILDINAEVTEHRKQLALLNRTLFGYPDGTEWHKGLLQLNADNEERWKHLSRFGTVAMWIFSTTGPIALAIALYSAVHGGKL